VETEAIKNKVINLTKEIVTDFVLQNKAEIELFTEIVKDVGNDILEVADLMKKVYEKYKT